MALGITHSSRALTGTSATEAAHEPQTALPPQMGARSPCIALGCGDPVRLTTKVLLKLPPRQATEIVASPLKMADLDWTEAYRAKDALPEILRKRFAARNPGCQSAEIKMRAALMNRFSALGTAVIVCTA